MLSYHHNKHSIHGSSLIESKGRANMEACPIKSVICLKQPCVVVEALEIGSNKGQYSYDDELEEGEIREDDTLDLEHNVDDVVNAEARDQEMFLSVKCSKNVLAIAGTDGAKEAYVEHGGNPSLIRSSLVDKDGTAGPIFSSTSLLLEGGGIKPEKIQANIEICDVNRHGRSSKYKKLQDVYEVCTRREEQLLLQQRKDLLRFKYKAKNLKAALANMHFKDLDDVQLMDISAESKIRKIELMNREHMGLCNIVESHIQTHWKKFAVQQVKVRNKEKNLKASWIEKANAGTLDDSFKGFPLSCCSYVFDQLDSALPAYRSLLKISSTILIGAEAKRSKYIAASAEQLSEKIMEPEGSGAINGMEANLAGANGSSMPWSGCANINVTENDRSFTFMPRSLGNANNATEGSSQIMQSAALTCTEPANTSLNTAIVGAEQCGSEGALCGSLERLNSLSNIPTLSKYASEGLNHDAFCPNKGQLNMELLETELSPFERPSEKIQFTGSLDAKQEEASNISTSKTSKCLPKGGPHFVLNCEPKGLPRLTNSYTQDDKPTKEQLALAFEDELSRLKRKYDVLYSEADKKLLKNRKRIQLLYWKLYCKQTSVVPGGSSDMKSSSIPSRAQPSTARSSRSMTAETGCPFRQFQGCSTPEKTMSR